MLEPTLFAGLDHQVHERVADLNATVAGIRAPHGRRTAAAPGVVARSRVAVGRFLVSLGSQVAGQPQS